jgi:hypothetical protein
LTLACSPPSRQPKEPAYTFAAGQPFWEIPLMKVQFETVDVFTDRQFGGNPLAVIADARGLSDAQMQAIANEFNLAETTFVLPPDDPANTARCASSPLAPRCRSPAIQTSARRLCSRGEARFTAKGPIAGQ